MLKRKAHVVHIPYWESDHVLNIAYNVLTGGTCLEDIERLHNGETYMNALEADRIPDPTTAGDFLRRFDNEDWIFGLQETFNESRKKVWRLQNSSFREKAIIDVDGTVAGTAGECKEGMDIAYNGIWGYAPLIVSLANTNEVLYPVNRPGSRPSCDGAAEWMDRAIEERGQRPEDAFGRSAFKLGLHGYRGAGLESQGLVWTRNSGARGEPRYPANGVQALPDQLHTDTLSDREHRPPSGISNSDLQPAYGNFLSDV